METFKHTVKAGERYSETLLFLPGESRDVSLEFDLIGPGAELSLNGLYLCGAEERVNIHVVVRHLSPGCNSRQLFKGFAGGTSKVSFDGLIVVSEDAQKTEAYQENHSILLSETAVVETSPQLEIYADDVKCSHGATVGRLDEQALFYLRSRGIPENEARMLQMISFIAPVTAGLYPEEREKVEAALSKLL